MTRKERLLNRFLRNPESLNFKEIEKLLFDFGFTEASMRGSHKKFRHNDLYRSLVIPIHNNDCKNVYKLKIAKIFEELL